MASDFEKLVEFIRISKLKNVSDEFLVSLLRQHGWSERKIYQGFSTYYESTLGTVVPSRGTLIEGAREAFYYLLAFITLGFWTVALVLFADQYVDRAIPSLLDSQYVAMGFRSAVAGQLATLTIAFPLFLFVSYLIGRETAQRPEALESGIRKWLTYIALVITAVTMLSDAVWFLSSFLSGDLTARFAWKALVLFVVAAGVFWYYLGSMRGESPSGLPNRVFGWVAVSAVAVALALGFTVIGSPAHERAYSLDRQRVTRLASIAGPIQRECACGSVHPLPLPHTLDDVRGIDRNDLEDPVTRQRFRYVPARGTHYQLCATFDTPSDQANGNGSAGWNHPAGNYCYSLDARYAAAYYVPYTP